MGVCNATFIYSFYVRNVVVLMYFIDEARIDGFEGVIALSNWLELSENRGARAKAGAVAAQRITRPQNRRPILIKRTFTFTGVPIIALPESCGSDHLLLV